MLGFALQEGLDPAEMELEQATIAPTQARIAGAVQAMQRRATALTHTPAVEAVAFEDAEL